jgi:phosphate/sulfate permease
MTSTRVRPAVLLLLAAAVMLLASWFTVSPVSASATTIPPVSGAAALQEGEAPAEETPSYIAPPDEEGTQEQVFITLAVITLIGMTLIGLAFGMYGYLQD